MCLSLSLSSFALCSFSFIFPPPPIRSHVCTPRWRSHSYRWILYFWILMDIDRYWWILVDTGGCFSSPTYPQPCRPRWRRRSCCKPDIEGRRGERSNPSWEFWKKCFDYTSWSYCFYSAFISELMLYFILRPLSIHSDPYQGLITCLSFQKINAFDTQRKIWRWMNLRVMRPVGYSVSDVLLDA